MSDRTTQRIRDAGDRAPAVPAQADQDLLLRLTARDPDAWQAFVDRFTPLIQSQIRLILRRHKAWHAAARDPEDLYLAVVQSFLENDCRTLGQYQGRCSLERWIRMTTTSRVVDMLRRERRDLSLEAEGDQGLSLLGRIRDTRPDAEQLCAERQRRDALRSLLASWPAEDRLLLSLTYGQEMPAERIACVMDLSREAVYTRRHRLLNRLRKALEEKFPGKI